MFTRLTSALIALVVVTGIIATEENEENLQSSATCMDVCCKAAELAPTIGWQASECKAAVTCLDKCPYKFCCTEYDTVNGVAANCTEHKS